LRKPAAGDYEDTLATVCYGMAPALLFAVPIVMFGYGIFFVGSALVSALLLSVPILLLVAGTMYAGVVGTHDLPPPKALAVVALTVAVWLIVAGVVSVGLSTA